MLVRRRVLIIMLGIVSARRNYKKKVSKKIRNFIHEKNSF